MVSSHGQARMVVNNSLSLLITGFSLDIQTLLSQDGVICWCTRSDSQLEEALTGSQRNMK